MVKTRTLKTVKNYTHYLINKGIRFRYAYLFGSHSKGLNNKDSDIDLALIFTHLSDKFETQSMLMKLRRKKDIDIEPHPIDIKDFKLSNPFAFGIIKNGIRIL